MMEVLRRFGKTTGSLMYMTIMCILGWGGMIALLRETSKGEMFEAMVVVWLISPLAFWHVATFERRSTWSDIFNPKTQAWSFLFGDTIVLPLAFALVANAYRTTSAGDRGFPEWWLVLLVIAVGLLVGYVFHEMERGTYEKASYGDHVDSDSKIYHDFVITPVLFGALLLMGLRMNETHWSWPWHWQWSGYSWPVICLVLVWIGLVIRDQTVNRVPWGHVAVPGRVSAIHPL